MGEGVGVNDFVSSLLFCYFCRWVLVVVVKTDHRYRPDDYFADVSVFRVRGGDIKSW